MYCGVATRICGAQILLYIPLLYARAPCTTQKILRNFAFSSLCIAALLLPLRCSSTFVHSAPHRSRALHYSKNPAQFCVSFFVYQYIKKTLKKLPTLAFKVGLYHYLLIALSEFLVFSFFLTLKLYPLQSFTCLFCVLRRCCSLFRCSNTFVYSAPLRSRALHYPKNPAQLCLSFLRITALLFPLSVLKYFCIFRSSSVTRLVLLKKSCATN